MVQFKVASEPQSSTSLLSNRTRRERERESVLRGDPGRTAGWVIELRVGASERILDIFGFCLLIWQTLLEKKTSDLSSITSSS